MPGLLDLPPELIDQIHHEYEKLLREQRYCPNATQQLGDFRLCSRYVERATRRSFVKTHFARWVFTAPDDASIQEFCAMAKTADLAKSVIEIDFRVDDDYTMRRARRAQRDHAGSLQNPTVHDDGCDKSSAQVQVREADFQTSTSTPSGNEATHVFDNGAGAWVPAAYFRNRDELIEAFRACENVEKLWFCNRYLDLKHIRRHKRKVLRCEADDEDEVEGDSDEDENDAERDDHDEDEDKDESRNGNKVAGMKNVDADADAEVDQGDGDDDDAGHDFYERCAHGSIPFDITSTYNYVLLLAGEAGMFPRSIMTFPNNQYSASVRPGLTSCSGLTTAKSTLKKLERLGFTLIENQHESKATSKATSRKAAFRLGKQIIDGLTHVPRLEFLHLSMKFNNTAAAWSAIAKAPRIPKLQNLYLNVFAVDIHDLTQFIETHSVTLKTLTFRPMHFTNSSLNDLGKLYELLSHAPKIEQFKQQSLWMDLLEYELVEFPSRVYFQAAGAHDLCPDSIYWKGHDEVKDVLGVMARHLRTE